MTSPSTSNGKPKWLLLDVGGVIIDTPNDFYSFAKKLNCDHKILEKVFSKYRNTYDTGASAKWFWNSISQELTGDNLSASTIEELISIEQKRWTKPNQNVVEEINHLSNQGYDLAILSNASHELAEVLNTVECAKPFKHIMISSTLHLIKPNPNIWPIVLRKLKTNPENILFIDDSQNNVDSGNSYGLTAKLWQQPTSITTLLNQHY